VLAFWKIPPPRSLLQRTSTYGRLTSAVEPDDGKTSIQLAHEDVQHEDGHADAMGILPLVDIVGGKLRDMGLSDQFASDAIAAGHAHVAAFALEHFAKSGISATAAACESERARESGGRADGGTIDSLAMRKSGLRDLFVALGYTRKYVDRAVEATNGAGENAVLDWFKTLWRPLNSSMFRYRDVAANGLLPSVQAMTSRLLCPQHGDAELAELNSELRIAAAGMAHLTLAQRAAVAVGGIRHVAEGAYCFPIFTAEFGAELVGEIDHYLRSFERAGMGFQMEEFGWLGAVKQLLDQHLVPIVRTMLPQFANVVRFRDIYAKIAKYGAVLDRDWPVHIDESDVTINLCLGTDFVGSGLQFVTGLSADGNRVPGVELGLTHYEHVAGQRVFHPGTLAHGVSWLASGSRYSVIILLNEAELGNRNCRATCGRS
jgi:hypothetical protein